MGKPIWSIKFRNFCFNNNISAQDVADTLKMSKATIYKYWGGHIPVPDESKKKLERAMGLPIYETFFNEEL